MDEPKCVELLQQPRKSRTEKKWQEREEMEVEEEEIIQSEDQREKAALCHVCQPVAVTDFLSSSSSLSLKSSRLPMSAGLTLIRLARLCMSSSLRNKDIRTKRI